MAAVVDAIRSSDDDGATRKIGARPSRSAAASQLAGLVGHEVRRDHAEPAGGREVAGERVDPVAQHRVPVGHHHGPPAPLRELLDDRERVADPDPALERGVDGVLDHRAVEHRVGVRQADLDEVGARVEGLR